MMKDNSSSSLWKKNDRQLSWRWGQLLSALKQGDWEAVFINITEFADNYVRIITRHDTRFSGYTEADHEDIVQNVLLKIEGSDRLKRMLFQPVGYKHLAKICQRETSGLFCMTSISSTLSHESEMIDEATDQYDELCCFEDVVRRLKPRWREAIEYRRNGYKYEDIAEMMNVSPIIIRMYIQRAGRIIGFFLREARKVRAINNNTS